MAHNLAYIDGRVAMAYQGETPWHSLGNGLRDVSKSMVGEALVDGNLSNWDVRHEPLFYNRAGTLTASPFAQAVIRSLDGEHLGAVGPKSVPIQNERAFAPLQTLIDNAGFEVETCGALGNGSRVWMLVKSPNSIHPVKGDKIDTYVLAIHAHDGSHALDFVPTFVRVVCNNTWTAAMSEIGEQGSKGRILKIKHTESADKRITAAEGFMRRFSEVCQANESFLSQLAATPLNPRQVAEMIEAVVPIEGDRESKVLTERRKTMAALVFTGVGAELAGSNVATGATNAWAVYNAITEYFDHVRPAEAKSDSARVKANESALFGANNAVKTAALTKMRELVAV